MGVIAFLGVAFYVLRALGVIRRGSGAGLGGGVGGKLNAWGLVSEKGGKGYFQIGGDEKGLGLLGGNVSNGKAD